MPRPQPSYLFVPLLLVTGLILGSAVYAQENGDGDRGHHGGHHDHKCGGYYQESTVTEGQNTTYHICPCNVNCGECRWVPQIAVDQATTHPHEDQPFTNHHDNGNHQSDCSTHGDHGGD